MFRFVLFLVGAVASLGSSVWFLSSKTEPAVESATSVQPFVKLQAQPAGLALTVTSVTVNPNGMVSLAGTVTANQPSGLTVYTPFVAPPPNGGPTSNAWATVAPDGRWAMGVWPTVQQRPNLVVTVQDWNGATASVTVVLP